MKSAVLYQILSGTVALTVASPCGVQVVVPFPGKFHSAPLKDALASAINDAGFHEYIAELTETYKIQPGSSYKLTPEGTLAEIPHNATNDGSTLVIVHNGDTPTLVIGGGKNETSNEVPLGSVPYVTVPLPSPPYPTGTGKGGFNGTFPGFTFSASASRLPSISFSGLPTVSFSGLPTVSISGIPTVSVSSASKGVTSTSVSSAATKSSSGALSASTPASSTLKTAVSSTSSSKTSSKTSASASATATAGCSNPEVYVEWRNMQTADKKAYVKAIRCL